MSDLVVNHHTLCSVDPDSGEVIPLCQEVSVLRNNVNLLTEEYSLTIELWINQKAKTFDIDRGALSTGIPALFYQQGFSLPASRDYVLAVQNYLLESSDHAPVSYYHDRLGYVPLDDKLVFLSDGIIGPSQKDSRYSSPEITRPSGTFDDWKDMVRTNVLNRDYPELALALGASGPLIPILKQASVFSENLVFGLIGPSSSGKTTMLRLIASIYGNPSESGGMIEDFNTTQNALFESLSNKTGFPTLIDEATSQPDWNFTSIIYNIPKGQGKRRCNQKGKVNPVKTFSGAVIVSGEHSLFEQSDSNAGLHARLLEFSFPWTDDANHAARLEQGCLQNHGTAVTPLLETILRYKDRIPDLYLSQYQKLFNSFDDISGVDDRLLKRAAIILTAATVARRAWKLKFHIKAMRALLMSHLEKHVTPPPLVEQVYDHLQGVISSQGSLFPSASPGRISSLLSQTLRGVQDKHLSRPCVWIIKQYFQSFLSDVKASSEDRKLLKEMREKGYLAYFGDRYLTSHKIGAASPLCYCLYLPSSSPAPSSCQPRHSSRVKDLLAPDPDDEDENAGGDSND